MILEITIPAEEGVVEDFEQKDDNIAYIRVFDSQNNEISKQCIYAVFF